MDPGPPPDRPPPERPPERPRRRLTRHQSLEAFSPEPVDEQKVQIVFNSNNLLLVTND